MAEGGEATRRAPGGGRRHWARGGCGDIALPIALGTLFCQRTVAAMADTRRLCFATDEDLSVKRARHPASLSRVRFQAPCSGLGFRCQARKTSHLQSSNRPRTQHNRRPSPQTRRTTFNPGPIGSAHSGVNEGGAVGHAAGQTRFKCSALPRYGRALWNRRR
ncbi:hypothetical protein DPEC_G00254060 [Dallia pectoralis]|uniref:Uncharacterized protein n=1 Tax=Dallia pectoralis TaxID=75939 RepID=A0ACC2FU57_DALPE|nr:hypothetical protein DPEC_G00254060 [Dallia pectoralis]